MPLLQNVPSSEEQGGTPTYILMLYLQYRISLSWVWVEWLQKKIE